MKKNILLTGALQENTVLTVDQMKKIKGGFSNSLKPCSAIICSSTNPCPVTCPPCYTNIGRCGI